MSKQVDALVIIGHSHTIAKEAPHYALADNEQGLWEMRHQHDTLAVDNEATHLYAGEVFLRLGSLAANSYSDTSTSYIKKDNPFKTKALAVFSEISPLAQGKQLHLPVSLNYHDMLVYDGQLPHIFDQALEQAPQIEQELAEKWRLSQLVHAKRGGVVLAAYYLEELLTKVGELNIKEIAPDVASFDSNANIIEERHRLSDLVARTDLTTIQAEFPYYSTFSEHKRNAPELLESAFEDLQILRKLLR